MTSSRKRLSVPCRLAVFFSLLPFESGLAHTGRMHGRRLLQTDGGSEALCSPATDIISGRGDTTLFASTITQLGLDKILDSRAVTPTAVDSAGSYTVLVPTDEAFLQYLDDAGLQLETLITTSPDVLSDLIKTHIITGESLSIADFDTGDEYATLNNGKALMLKSSIEPIVKEGDLQACGATIHVIDFFIPPEYLIGDDAPNPAPTLSPKTPPIPSISPPAPQPENGLLSPPDAPSPSPIPLPSPEISPSPFEDDLLPVLSGTSPTPLQTEDDLLPLLTGASQTPSVITCATASSLLQSRDDTKIFYSMVTNLGLDSWLEETVYNPFTIFVPTDEAFLTSGIDLEGLAVSNLDAVEQILRNHIIQGQSLKQNDFNVGSTYKTMNEGQLLQLDSPISPIIKEADIESCESQIHIIDMVLVPDFLDLSVSQTASSTTGSSSGTSVDATYVNVNGGSAGGFSAIGARKNGGTFNFNAISFSG